MYRFFLLTFAILGACNPIYQDEIDSRAETKWQDSLPTNPFPRAGLRSPAYSNLDLARDFLDLSFSLESGRSLPVFTRFNGPISVHLPNAIPKSLATDLNRLIQRLQNEANLDIYLTNSDQANITIQPVLRSEIHKVLPNAACFVAPNVSTLAEFQRQRNTKTTSWSHQTERKKVAIFLPYDAAPQELRDCLHEEFAQALGPLNDLYRLTNSVFNDDNVHTILTGFDMLILKITYAPELRSGMSRTQVQSLLPIILAQINPKGEAVEPNYLKATPRLWIDLIQASLNIKLASSKRRTAAHQSVEIAQARGWQDHRLGLSYFALALMTEPQDPQHAKTLFQSAMRVFQHSSESRLHRAFAASHLASYALVEGHPQAALDLLEPSINIVMLHENATLLVTLMLLKAEALEMLDRSAEARSVRLDSLLWARYGFGTEQAWNRKRRDISRLSAQVRNGG